MRWTPPYLLIVLLVSGLQAAGAQDPLPGDPAGDPPEPQAGPPALPRIYVVVDRFKEFGGRLVRENDYEFVVRRDNRETTYQKNKVMAMIRLLELPPEGREGRILLRGGGWVEGRVVEDGFEEVVLLIEGIRHGIPRAEVSHINLKPGFEEELERARAAMDPTNVDRRLELVRWMIERDRLELAAVELEAILQMEDRPLARQQLNALRARIELGRGAGTEPRPESPREDRTAGLPERSLTPEDVNIIRVYEIDFQNPPAVEVEPATIRRLIENHASHPSIPEQVGRRDALFALEDIDQVRLIFEVQATELYPEITVREEPESINLFRTRVHNAWLIRNCATSGCHGGQDAGDFFLHRYAMNSPRTVYENLLILERTRLESGDRMIDYENPKMSLLVQYALPRSEARLKHPAVPGFAPAFPSGGGRAMADTLRFIDAMYQPRPDYPVTFEVPKVEPPENTAPERVPR